MNGRYQFLEKKIDYQGMFFLIEMIQPQQQKRARNGIRPVYEAGGEEIAGVYSMHLQWQHFH